MLTKIKTLLGNTPDQPAMTERMPPDEGMRYRHDMLYQSVRESMLAMEVLSNMYKFKAINVDPQTFIVMVEVSKLFQARWNGMPASLAQIERRMITGALNRANVTLQAVYWRVDETVDTFIVPARAVEGTDTASVATRKREIPGDVSNASLRLARRHAESASEDGQEAFLAATRHRTRPPTPAASRPGPMPSPSAPEAGSEVGGTQYGQL